MAYWFIPDDDQNKGFLGRPAICGDGTLNNLLIAHTVARMALPPEERPHAR
jgi:hypothetical protein